MGPLDRTVDAVLAGIRLEGWALWCEVSALADLITAWTDHPPLEAPPDPPVEAIADDGSGVPGGAENGPTPAPPNVDPELAQRLGTEAASADDGYDRHGLTAAQSARLFAEAEVALACGWSRYGAAKRVRAADFLLIQRRLPRVGLLLRAGLLERDKLNLLVSRLGDLEELVAECVEERLIPDHDVPVLPDLPHVPDLVEEGPGPARRARGGGRGPPVRRARCSYRRGAGLRSGRAPR